jgi:carbonic anhydrase
MFEDILAANDAYARTFGLDGLEGKAALGLGVLTCIDTRIEPLQMLGIKPGDAKILRNAGARVTDDVLRTLALAVAVLGVERICIVQHTDCGVFDKTNDELAAAVAERVGATVIGWDFLPIDDHTRVLEHDIAVIRSCVLLPPDLPIAGFVYDVHTGRLEQLTPDGD